MLGVAFLWKGRTALLSAVIGSSTCLISSSQPPHPPRTPGRRRRSPPQRWRAPRAGGSGVCQHVPQHRALYFSALMWQDTALSASLGSFELAQPGTFYGVPLAQLIAQAGPDTHEMEFVWKKTHPTIFICILKEDRK